MAADAPQPVLDDAHPLQRSPGLVLVMNTSKGRGVFASQNIPSGTVIDVSPVLIFSAEEVENHTSKTCLAHYTYYWPSESGRTMTQALALGLGSMFNHSTLRQNVGWKRNTEIDCIVYIALRDIEQGEELCISYGSARLWFDDADASIGLSGAVAAQNGVDGNDDDRDDMGGETLAELELSGLGNIQLAEISVVINSLPVRLLINPYTIEERQVVYNMRREEAKATSEKEIAQQECGRRGKDDDVVRNAPRLLNKAEKLKDNPIGKFTPPCQMLCYEHLLKSLKASISENAFNREQLQQLLATCDDLLRARNLPIE